MAAPTTTASVTPTTSRWLGVGLVLAVTTFAFDSLAIAAALPTVVDDLGGVSLYGAAFTGFSLAQLFSLCVAGPQADRRGPAPVLGFGLAVFAFGLVVGGLAPTMPIVVLGRVLQGLGAGTIATTAYVAIGRAYDDQQRPKMFALLSAAWVVPSLIGPAAAGALADGGHWRWVFLGLLPFPLIAAVMAFPALRHLGPLEGAGADRAGDRRRAVVAFGLAVSVGALVLGLEAADHPAGLAVAVVGLVAALPLTRALLPPGTWRLAVGLPAVVAARFTVAWAFYGTDAFLPLAVTDVRGQRPLVASASLTAASLAWATGSWAQTKLQDRVARPVLVGWGMFALGVGGLLATTVGIERIPLGVMIVGWMLAGAGMGVGYTTLSLAGMAAAPGGEEGLTSSFLQLADTLAIALITGIGGALVGWSERAGGPALSWALGAVFMVAALAILPGLAASRRMEQRSTEA